MTWLTLSTSMPRAATSVATSTRILPDLNASSARWRWLWFLLPWIAAASTCARTRRFITRSAPCLVRVKTSTLRMSSPSSRRSRSGCFISRETWWTRCSILGAALATGATSTRTGSVRSESARWRISFGMVAEKSMVWRFFDTMDAMVRIGLMNPMSSIRSASSSTRMWTSERLQWRCWIRSSRRPGVATTMSTPPRSAFTCAFCPTPP